VILVSTGVFSASIDFSLSNFQVPEKSAFWPDEINANVMVKAISVIKLAALFIRMIFWSVSKLWKLTDIF